MAFAAASIAAAQSPLPASAIWQIQNSGTAAGLRGIDSVDGVIAWASGTGGTILKTIDGGAHWQQCAIPDAATDGATLDFRGIQAWDAQTAIVMASGPGRASRIYKTTDGCRSWILRLRNTDPDGFYDAMVFWDRMNGLLIGDPTATVSFAKTNTRETQPLIEFAVQSTQDGGATWTREIYSKDSPMVVSPAHDSAAFAASNSCVTIPQQHNPATDCENKSCSQRAWVGIGGKGGAKVFSGNNSFFDAHKHHSDQYGFDWLKSPQIPLTGGSESSGVFSLGSRMNDNPGTEVIFKGGGGAIVDIWTIIAVGGDYTKPDQSTGTAAWSSDGGHSWTASTTPPHGYRSAVQWCKPIRAWITAGTNGSDISRDDGKTWQPLDNGNWNALSFPFAVGPKGRIARFNPGSLPAR